jgi:hypothetical protein
MYVEVWSLFSVLDSAPFNSDWPDWKCVNGLSGIIIPVSGGCGGSFLVLFC